MSKKNRSIRRITVLLVLGQLLSFGACKPPKRDAERNPVPEHAIGEVEERRGKKEADEDEESGGQTGGRSKS